MMSSMINWGMAADLGKSFRTTFFPHYQLGAHIKLVAAMFSALAPYRFHVVFFQSSLQRSLQAAHILFEQVAPLHVAPQLN